MRRDGERELVAGKQNAAAFLFAKIDMLLELSERRDPVFELPFPIVPEFGRDLGPIARRMRDELFPIALFCRKSDHFELRRKTLRSLTIVSTQAPKSAPRTSCYATLRMNSIRAGLAFLARPLRPWSLDRDERADRDFGKELACRF